VLETIIVPPFGLFKRKSADTPSVEQSIPTPSNDILSIQQAQDLLQSLESVKMQELSARLIRIKESAGESLEVIDTLAKEMDRENIKLEGLEQRLKSVVECHRSSEKLRSSFRYLNPQMTSKNSKKGSRP
jgi:vacuolar-type H+-ATPase subunit I/STV1